MIYPLNNLIQCVMTVCYTTVGVFLSSHLGDYSELISNGLLLLISIATLLWSYTLSGRAVRITVEWRSITDYIQSESGSPAYIGGKTLWVQNENKEGEGERCESPLMNENEEDRGRWMPDVIPPLPSNGDRPTHSILSPATHILTDPAPIYGEIKEMKMRLSIS